MSIVQYKKEKKTCRCTNCAVYHDKGPRDKDLAAVCDLASCGNAIPQLKGHNTQHSSHMDQNCSN